MRVPFSPQPLQHLLLLVLLVTAFLTGGGWYLLVVLLCISLVASEVEQLFIQGPAQKCPFYYKIFYHKTISMWFCSITISYSSPPYDMLGELFKLKL